MAQTNLRLVAPTGLPAVLRSERARRGLTQAEVAEWFGVRTQTVGQWERGSKAPQPRFHAALAEFLNIESAHRVRSLLREGPRAHSPVAEDLGIDQRLGSEGQAGRGRGADQAPVASSSGVDAEIRLNVSRYLAALNGRATPDELQVMRSLLTGT